MSDSMVARCRTADIALLRLLGTVKEKWKLDRKALAPLPLAFDRVWSISPLSLSFSLSALDLAIPP